MDFTPDEWQAISLTLQVAVVAVLGSLPFAIAVAIGSVGWIPVLR